MIDYMFLKKKKKIAEIAFSSLKRVLSEDPLSKKFNAQKVMMEN
jgi:hypothetical protein